MDGCGKPDCPACNGSDAVMVRENREFTEAINTAIMQVAIDFKINSLIVVYAHVLTVSQMLADFLGVESTETHEKENLDA